MELALLKFDGLGDRPAPARKPWMVSPDSPASLDPVCSTDLVRSPSTCLNLEALSSDDAEESVRPRDISVTLLCGSEDGHTPVDSDQVLSDVDLPTAADSRDRRQVFRTHDLSPVEWYSQWSVSVGHPKVSPEERMQHSACVQTSAPEVWPKADSPRLSAAPVPVPPRWSDELIYQRWDGWRPSNSLRLRCPDNCPPGLLRRLPSRIWGTRRFHCPLIASRWGDHRRFRKTEVCLMCRQFRGVFYGPVGRC